MNLHRVVFSPSAREHLARIADFIGQDNPRRAVSFIQELRRRCFDLAAHPMVGPVTRRSHGRTVRRIVHGRYNIFYRVEPATIEIMAILPGAMDLDAIMPQDTDDEPTWSPE